MAEVLAVVLAAAALAGPPACRTGEIRQHDEAVFGHFATRTAAQRSSRRIRRAGFKGLKIENDGCGDFELEIDGADTQQQRGSFAAEAQRAGYQVMFEQTGEPLAPARGQVVGVLASRTSLAAAGAYGRRLAGAGFRYVDIVPSGARWLVVMPQVPVRASLPIAKELARAGFHVAFRNGSG